MFRLGLLPRVHVALFTGPKFVHSGEYGDLSAPHTQSNIAARARIVYKSVGYAAREMNFI